MLYRELGSTGEQVSAIGLGGWHLSLKHVDEELAIRIVRTAIDRGITFMDNCWDYNGGESEVRMGKALRDGYRDKVFLMTKIDGRSKKEATRQLEESLRRLQTDRIDLVQHHEILRYEDPHRIFDEEGAQAALIEARAAGKLRYIGFTGHKDPRIHLRMLAHDYPFDAVQLPLNCFDASFRSFERQVLPELVARGIAAIGMKSLGGEGDPVRKRVIKAEEGLRYAMSLPVATTVSGIDSLRILRQNLRIARDFKPMTDREMAAHRKRLAATAADGRFELYKTTAIFDGDEGRRAHGFPTSKELSA